MNLQSVLLRLAEPRSGRTDAWGRLVPSISVIPGGHGGSLGRMSGLPLRGRPFTLFKSNQTELPILSLRKASCRSEILPPIVLPPWVLPCLPMVRCLLKSCPHSSYTLPHLRAPGCFRLSSQQSSSLANSRRGVPRSLGWRESLALCNSDPLGTGAGPSWWAPGTPHPRPLGWACGGLSQTPSPCRSWGSSTETHSTETGPGPWHSESVSWCDFPAGWKERRVLGPGLGPWGVKVSGWKNKGGSQPPLAPPPSHPEKITPVCTFKKKFSTSLCKKNYFIAQH